MAVRPKYTKQVAEFVAHTSLEAVPAAMIWTTKRVILDTIGNAIGGYSTNGARRALDAVTRLGGHPDSTTLVTGHKTSPAQAVFANAMLATTLSADDSCLLLGHHGQSSVFPALALTEQRDLTGADFLAATALAYEASARIASAARHIVRRKDGSLASNPSGGGENWISFAAAFSAGRAARLGSEAMANAMGLAGFTASIPTAARWNRPAFNNMKVHPYAFTAQNGTMAVLLTESGFTGDGAILDADVGQNCADWWTMAGILASDPESAFAGMGEDWITLQTAFKPYPSCRFLQGPISLLTQIMKEEGVGPDRIERVDVYTDGFIRHYHMDSPVVECEEDCQFSMPHVLTMAALGVTPGPDWVQPSFWHDPIVESFKDRVRCHVMQSATDTNVSQLLEGRWERYPHKIVVTGSDFVFERSGDYIIGDAFVPETRLDDGSLFAKFRNFVSGQLSGTQAERCIDIIMTLDEQKDVRELIACLHSGSQLA